jgi:5-methyltetrahydrofolate--homocysteine methyltransferase
MNSRETAENIAARRILILDGAMGSMIQAWKSPGGKALDESSFRGSRFANHPVNLAGCNDILCLTMPELISGIHEAYLEAGADIIETCSFNSTEISLRDYGLGGLVYEISKSAAGLARKAADRFFTTEKPRFVAGSMGPTAKSASYTADIDNPGKRAVTWDELETAYYDNARGLLDGGVDFLIVETVFDSLNAKTALFAISRLEAERNIDVPVIVSATVSESGRLLTGQRVEAFCDAVLHAEPLAVGLNCSFGAEAMKPHLAKLSAWAPCPVCVYPNAGLPDRRGVYSDTPELMAAIAETLMKEGMVNIIGGCCGSTPAHIAAIAEKARHCMPRPIRTAGSGSIRFDETCSVDTGAAVFGPASPYQKAVDAGDYLEAAELAGEDAENAEFLPLRPDNAPEPAVFVKNCIFVINCFSKAAALPVYIESSHWAVIESALKCLQGRGMVRYLGLKKGSPEYEEKAALVKRYGAVLLAG